ncbi:fumarylacetoacetate hydrolase family protein [Amycolatopsis thermoflava]|uniref:fumarylacetoacetate hydrolase family protein n=1 Tax=Amycolatopsis thermoflava TaxID=84480 RepID=UPI003D74DC64
MDTISGIEAPSLVSVVTAGGASRAAIATPEALWSHPLVDGHLDVLSILATWASIAPRLTDVMAAAAASGKPPGARPLTNVTAARLLGRPPAKVLCSGPNFTDHLAEMGEFGLGEEWQPYFFLKPPSTTIRASREAFESDSPDDKVDWEGELAVVIGVGGRDIPIEDVAGHVAGYTVANDISLRGPHRRDTPAAPFQWDWVASKAADGSLPLGPGLVPAAVVGSVADLPIRTTVNGIVQQDGTTANMVCSVAELVAHASRLLTLEPGDIVLTGTPAGVGAGRGTFLRPGDEVAVSIIGVGTLTTPISSRETR